MTLYKGKYRIESTRLKDHDYSSNGWYFVTICTSDRLCYFGDIVHSKMQLSVIGEIAQEFWVEIPEHFNNIFIDAYVIMPNHVHGIVIIEHPVTHHSNNPVETRHGASLQTSQNLNNQSNQFSPLKKGSLSLIINAYKSSVTRWCRKNGYHHFAWQPRFYDHIIRDDDSLDRIRDYIHSNPAKWEEDKDNVSNLWM